MAGENVNNCKPEELEKANSKEREFLGPRMTQASPLKSEYSEWSEYLEKTLRLTTYPLAVKMCRKEEEIPTLAKMPTKEWGYHLDVCQAMAMSRRTGEMIVMKFEDMWCFEAPLGFGMVGNDIKKYKEGLKYFLEGKTRYPDAAKNLEVAKKWAHTFPRFDKIGEYIAIVTAPLMKAAFEPDLILLWLNPTALNFVLSGIVAEWGTAGVNCTMAAHGGCCYYVIPPIKNNEFNVSNPCLGDISFAMKEPGDLVFSCPIAKAERLINGIKYIAKNGRCFPTNYDLRPEGRLPAVYQNMREILGMD